MDNHIIDKLVTETLANRLAEGELGRAHLEARYTLTLAELQGFKAVLEYEPALQELFDETQAKMKGTNA
ncbi:hypothetical protein [Streptococcus mitis]|uniref:Uncharacterized protein n=1 Tax=Streptococcus mitis TaxID=28037 RepID=A0A139PJY1_STRMT|nr:hypothetical protein [Streptococcus mitis]KXT90645.1 hypothetical protein SMIDD26_01991 [Streptococcus mitis]